MPSIWEKTLLLSLLGTAFASPAYRVRRDYDPPYTTTAYHPGPTPAGPIPNCGAYYQVQSGDTCDAIGATTGISSDQLRQLNPSINAACSNLIVGYDYCVGQIAKAITPRRIPPQASSSPTPTRRPGKTPSSGSYIPPPGPTKPGTTKCCREWHTVVSGDTCLSMTNDAEISMNEFRSLNPDVNGACNNLWIGYSYCVDGDDTCSPTTTPTKPPVSTPTPTQSGMAKGCTKFYQAQSGDYCQSVAYQFGIDVGTFIKWNPAVGQDCTGMLAGYYYCVGK